MTAPAVPTPADCGGGGDDGDILAQMIAACRDAMAVAGSMYGLSRAARRAALKAVREEDAAGRVEAIAKGASEAEVLAYERTFAEVLGRCLAANRDNEVVRFSFTDVRTGGSTAPDVYTPSTAAADWRPWRDRLAKGSP